jgi:endonuclease YncB( thermonuclease family)
MDWVGYTRRLVGAAAAGLILIDGSALAGITGPPRVIDGDTLEIAGQRIRLLGVDAPELEQSCQHAGRDYACGKVARATLWNLIGGLDVSCEPEGAVPAQDGTMRAICKAGKTNLNEAIVRSGWALADPHAPDRYEALQTDAEQARRGLWQGAFEPPWRRRHAPAYGHPHENDAAR